MSRLLRKRQENGKGGTDRSGRMSQTGQAGKDELDRTGPERMSQTGQAGKDEPDRTGRKG
jgi:hypothetical protein